MGEETTIMGTVLSVVFQNEENGYAVLRLVTDDGELLTLVGCVPCAAPGENLTATGSFSSHPQYGEQFSASEVERYLPSNETEILNYLASGVVRGVGPATAEKLVARFGIETLQVLESEPEKLTAIKGMTARRAQEISAAFNEQMGLRRVMEFLAHYDLPAALSVPLYRRFGANAMAALERNPYLLSDSAFGVDFSVCDEIALSMGFGGDASLRTEAGLLFELSHNRDAGGHVFLPREKLLAATAQLLDCDVDAVEKSLDDLIALHRIVQEGVANVTACYLRQSWEDETYVVARIEAMLADKPDALRGVERVIKEIEREQGVQYAPLQRQAVELAAKEELLLLTGGPGTGKTTSVRAIVALFERMGLNVLLAAPTGRAAKRMGELCDRDAQTIHRMLGMTFNDQTGEVTFTKGEKEPLEADALIVDETSMVDLSLMRALLAALRPGCRLVLVGDPDQLPSVGGERIFRPHSQRAHRDRCPARHFPSGRAVDDRAQRAPRQHRHAAQAQKRGGERLFLPPPPRQRTARRNRGRAVQNKAARQNGHPRGRIAGAHPDAPRRRGDAVAELCPAGRAEPAEARQTGAPLRRAHLPRG